MEEHIQKKVKNFKSIFMEKSQWNIHSGKWGRLQAKHAFLSWPQMHPKVLQLYGNKEPNLIKFIILPYFMHLKQLNLKNNKITTISMFSQLQAPQLEELLLGDNYITHIREMRKMNCPHLIILSLYANRICELQSFETITFNYLQVIILGLNCISNVKSLNKCTWSMIRKVSIENNRKIGNQLTRWDSRPEIVYG